jgi:solute carrier family 9B (sodium/hydrogen exchanger), member 1/2
MLLSLSIIILSSLFMSAIFTKLKIPRIIGILCTGIIIGPYVLDLIAPEILFISTDLRQVALIVILVRAGLSLDLKDLKKVGKPAILLSFIPATFEMVGITLLAPLFFDITYLEATIMGSIVAAVSPAVVVPRMIELMKHQKGQKHQVPQLILAGASLDDIYVIVLFMSFIQAEQSGSFQWTNILMIPVSILSGAMLGFVTGRFMAYAFKKYHTRDTIKVLMMFSFAFLFVTLEQVIKDIFPISGMIAVITFGIAILKHHEILAKRLIGKFEKIWVIAEIMLFVLVGAALNPSLALETGFQSIILICLALLIRTIGVWMAVWPSQLTKSEKIFVSISYLPKATVQAAIGAIPLSLGISGGGVILSVAVVSILMTAPLGAILMDHLANKLLSEPSSLPI